VDTLQTLAGAIVVLTVLFEVLWTAGAEGAGPITKRVAHLQWELLLILHRRVRSHGLLVAGGLGVFVFTLAVWVVALWAGWVLVFNGDRTIIDAATRMQADEADLIYFTGYTIFTLGTGDFIPNGALWQVLTPIASLTGLFVVTLAITYLVQVIQALTHKRQVALRISAMGTSGVSMVRNMCGPDDAGGFSAHLQALTEALATLQQQLLSYPVLHYMHTRKRSLAIAPAVAALDEALSIFEQGIDRGPAIDRGTFRPIRQVITELLETLDSAFIDAAETPPAPPALERLRGAGLPVVEDAAFRARMAKLGERRQLLCGWVEADGWEWDDLQHPDEITPPSHALAA
jgi:hypothetical protein